MSETKEVKENLSISKWSVFYPVLVFLLAVLSALAVSIDYSIVTDTSVLEITNPIVRFTESFTYSLKNNYLSGIILCAAVFWLLLSLRNLKLTRRAYIIAFIISFLMAVVVLVGQSYAKTNSADLLWSDGVQIAKTIVGLLGYFSIFAGASLWLFHKMDEYDIKEQAFVCDKLVFFKKHIFLISVVILIICWLPRIISAYPGIFMGDTRYQLRQIYGEAPLSILHPIVHTVLFGIIIRPIEYLTGSPNVGVYMYALIQCGFTIAVLAKTVQRTATYVKRITIPCVMLACYCFVPVFSSYAMTLTKDSIYAPIVVLWMIELMDLLSDSKNYKKFVKFFLLALLVVLFRNNGIYIIAGTLLIVMAFLREHRKKLIVGVLGMLLFWNGLNQFCVNVLGVQGGSTGEMLSVPFQQTARYVRDYPKEVTEEEKNAIDKVLDYGSLAEKYDPVRADPVKYTYKQDCTGKELAGYIKTWWSMFCKHPGVYVEAFINQTYGHFYFSETPIIYSSRLSETAMYDLNHMTPVFNFSYTHNGKLKPVFNYSHSHFGWMDELRELYDKYYYFVGSVPLLGILLTTALWQWVIVFMVSYLILKRKQYFILAYVPLLILLLTNVAGPVNGSIYFRYEYPIAFCVPCLVFWTLAMCKKKTEQENET